MGYEKSPQVEFPGPVFPFAAGIIDIFDMTEENPYRIELWETAWSRFEALTCCPSVRWKIWMRLRFIRQRTDAFRRRAGRTAARIKKRRKQYAKNCGNRAIRAHRIETQIKKIGESAQGVWQCSQSGESFVRIFLSARRSPFWNFSIRKRRQFFWMSHSIVGDGERETEFRESMTGRLEKGYILPGQARFVPEKEIAGSCRSIGQCHSPRWMQRATCLSRIAGLKSRCAKHAVL